MTRLLPALLLLCSCWGHSFPGWDATEKAGFERMAAARLQACVQGNPCAMLSFCFEQSRQFCLDAGYAKECGQAEPEGSCGVRAHQDWLIADGGWK